jgi:hypothetical protein
LQYFHTIKYVYRNPIRAGVCERVEAYPYSSLRGLLGYEAVRFPVAPSPFRTFSGPATDWLPDLNRPSNKEHEESIRLALRRRAFTLPKERAGRKRTPSKLESEPS